MALASVFVGSGHGVTQSAQYGGRSLHELCHLQSRVSQGSAPKLSHAKLIAVASHLWARRPDHSPGWFQIKNRLRNSDTRLPIHTCVMRLRVERDLPALKTINDEKLPQRSASIQQAGVQARHILLQQSIGSGLR